MKKKKRRTRKYLGMALLLWTAVLSLALFVHAATSGDLTGLSDSNIGASYTATDDGNNVSWSASGNTISGTAIGKAGSGCSSDTHYETTLTLTNNKSTTATLSFEYTIDLTSGTIQVAGNGVTASGSYSGELAAGASIKVYLKSGSTSAATSISITNLTLVSDVSATTTFLPGENGSYTVDGVEITAETSRIQSSTQPYTLVATPASGYRFWGWLSVSDNKYLSLDATATLKFDSNQTIKPVFIDASLGIFSVNGTKFYDLNEANTYALSNGGKIILIQDGTLPSKSYTISSGNTLIIPFDSDNTYYTTSPESTTTAATLTAYRTLTMAPGASIDVQGAISVGAKHYTGMPNFGNPTGAYGYIKMQEGSSIIVKNGGALYAWGFISGNGHITAESGAFVYEYFQVTDWRGGTAGLSMRNNSKNVFPISQYYVQNIEVPLTLQHGAAENLYTSITASGITAHSTVSFVGTGALFELSEGSSFTKTYDPTTDRMIYDVTGNMALKSVSIKISIYTINSADYVLPINNNTTLNIHSGTTSATKDVALLPGVQVCIDSGAELKVSSGTSAYIYDKDQWGVYCYGGQFKPIAYSPTKVKTRSTADLVDVTIDVNGTITADGYLYTTAGGADIKSSEGTGKVVLNGGAGSSTTTYQATQDNTTITYVDIPITSAQLHNGPNRAETEPEYTTTTRASAGTTYNYCTTCDIWHTGSHYTVNFYIAGKLADTVHITSGNSVTYNIINMDTCDYSGYSYNAETGVLTINNLTNPETDVHLTLKEIISVTIDWGSLNFVYTKGAWNPQTHTYQVGTIGPESEGANIVTITNSADTNINLVAHVTYSKGDYNGDVTGTLEYGGSSGTSLEIELTQGDTAVKKVSVTLSPNDTHAENATVGTITVTISKPDEGGS